MKEAGFGGGVSSGQLTQLEKNKSVRSDKLYWLTNCLDSHPQLAQISKL